MGGKPLVNVRRVGGKHNTLKQADSGFGDRCSRKSSEAPLRPDLPLPIGPLNLMTFTMGGTPRAGSQHIIFVKLLDCDQIRLINHHLVA